MGSLHRFWPLTQLNINASLLGLRFWNRGRRLPPEARLALIGSEEAARVAARSLAGSLFSQIKLRLGDAEHLLVQRLAGTVFLIRVASAALAFASQVLLARWMGSFEFGIYVYVWTWVLLLGQAIDLGLGTAAQRFVPEYREPATCAAGRAWVQGLRFPRLADNGAADPVG